MEFIFLGTSSGSPTKQRNVSGLALKSSRRKSWCLVDCGEGTQHQLLHTPLALSRLSAIMITHVHGDHCLVCSGGGDQSKRHNLLRKSVFHMCQSAALNPELEKPGLLQPRPQQHHQLHGHHEGVRYGRCHGRVFAIPARRGRRGPFGLISGYGQGFGGPHRREAG